jgi:hypothetical protein
MAHDVRKVMGQPQVYRSREGKSTTCANVRWFDLSKWTYVCVTCVAGMFAGHITIRDRKRHNMLSG